MKRKRQKTPHAERRTPNGEWAANATAREDPPAYSASLRQNSTSNAQRPTLNTQARSMARFDLEDRLLEFSARIIRLADSLPNSRAANHLAGQLLRCGTSSYGNHGEVEAAESRKDFIHKLKICLKELKETRRWLRLATRSDMIPTAEMATILSETEQLIKIFFSSIRTAERNAK